MSTNYYARIIPSKERKEELKALIDNNDYQNAEDLFNELYGKPHFDGEKLTYGIVHLGQRSSGWKFLWNPNLFEKCYGHRDNDSGKWITEPSEQVTVYGALDKEHIKAFIDREDVIIIDEYKNPIDKEEFWNMALNWCKDGFDIDEYNRIGNSFVHYAIPNRTTFIKSLIEQGYDYRLSRCGNEFYSDGLRFCSTNEFS